MEDEDHAGILRRLVAIDRRLARLDKLAMGAIALGAGWGAFLVIDRAWHAGTALAVLGGLAVAILAAIPLAIALFVFMGRMAWAASLALVEGLPFLMVIAIIALLLHYADVGAFEGGIGWAIIGGPTALAVIGIIISLIERLKKGGG